MRKIRYQVACSLDGYIAGPNGEYDWIVIGGGIPFLPAPAVRRRLALTGQRIYEKSGIVLLRYDVVPEADRPRSGKRKAAATRTTQDNRNRS